MSTIKTTVEISPIKLSKVKIIAIRKGKTFKELYSELINKEIEDFERKNGPIKVD